MTHDTWTMISEPKSSQRNQAMIQRNLVMKHSQRNQVMTQSEKSSNDTVREIK